MYNVGLTCASLSSGFIFAMCLLFRVAWWFLASDCSWGLCTTTTTCSWGTWSNHSWVNFIFYLFLQVPVRITVLYRQISTLKLIVG
jgi:hypothetical protein